MKSSFNLLVSRNIDDGVGEIELLEKQFNFKLPPLYKLFAQSFYLGEKYIKREVFLSPTYHEYFPCTTYNFYHNGEDIGFSHFIEIQKAFSVYASGGLSDFLSDNMFFPIASSDGNGLYLGTQTSSIDKIFWDRADAMEPRMIANNIFEFVRGIQIKPASTLYGDVLFSQLYKIWDEDFWRVKR
ncbi:SMI1/KNR4 family protein [Terrimonas pollutisoli]|uniref:SMI1/KNR4 family protein n=1 Tax=Terrimonas pollutisoli TaxID=3034147 RepID=UPI0023EB8C61|nr:SMI1/KNR4 family protein [Terrimonas sp. H1YJ31]